MDSQPEPKGRPSSLTPEVHDKLVAAIRAGNYARVAADFAGISESTFYRWLRKGQAEESGDFHELWIAVKKAESESEVRAVANVQRHMQDDWRAAMAFLSRRYPDRWGRHDRLSLDVDPREALAELLGMRPEEIDGMVDGMARRSLGHDEPG
ncbi:MAG: hypothetical protein MI919_05440 [Holophagales bacterium]|nr:hypothetical protein [Holophagales bacterium]